MITKIMTLIAVVATLLLQGCVAPIPPDEKIEGIVRILMHEPGRYTLLTQESATSPIIEQQSPHGALTDATYVLDVPEGQPMWVSSHSERAGVGAIRTHLVFHIHSVQDINGAGWRNNSKFERHGQTTVIE